MWGGGDIYGGRGFVKGVSRSLSDGVEGSSHIMRSILITRGMMRSTWRVFSTWSASGSTRGGRSTQSIRATGVGIYCAGATYNILCAKNVDG